MRKIFLFYCLILFIGCQTSRQFAGSFSEVSVVTADKIVKSNGSTVIDATSINIISLHDYLIYKTRKITYRDSKTTIIGDTTIDRFINPDTAYVYYVIKREDKLGLSYEEDSLKHAIRFSLDSLLKEIGIHASMLGVYNLDLGIPSEVSRLGRHVVIERFLNKKHVPEDPDSIYRYYDNRLRQAPFSFSPSLDKMKKSKLIRTRFITMHKGSNVKRSEFYAEIIPLEPLEPKKYKNLISRYINDINTINMKQ